MAAAGNLTLKNSADVNVVYGPVKIKTGEYAQYVDRTQGVLALQPVASLAYSENEDVRKVVGTVTYPVLNATTGVVEKDFGRFEYTLRRSHTADDRLNVRKRLAALIADSIVTTAVDNGETPW